MNQSLINELRALDVKISVHIKAVEAHKDDPHYPLDDTVVYGNLLAAKANCLNAIAVLVAANKR